VGYGGRTGGVESNGYGGRPGGYGGQSGGVESEGYGHGNVGLHMQASTGADLAGPARGRPGIHPSRLVNMRSTVSGHNETEHKAKTREELVSAKYSVLSEADRAKALEAEEREKQQVASSRKRPGRRRARESAGSQISAEERAAKLRAERAKTNNNDNKGARRGGFNLNALMQQASGDRGSSSRAGGRNTSGSALAEAKKKEEAQKKRQRDAYMGAVLGRKGLMNLNEIEEQRRRARKEREADIRNWARVRTVARNMRDTINLMHYENERLFPRNDGREKKGNMESFGMKKKTYKVDPEVERICFVEICDI